MMHRFRSLAAVSVLSVLASALPLTSFAAFTDVKSSTQYGTAINALHDDGILEGYSNGTFRSTATINRAEFAKIVASMLDDNSNMLEECQKPETRQAFPDVKKTDWFFPYICALHNEGNIIQGYPDGMFHPERDINFVEAGKILTLAYKQQVQNNGGEWYMPYAEALESSKAIPPTVKKLDAQITRGEMAEIMWRLSEGKTDQPSKGVLNLEHPELTINTASDDLQYVKTCAELSAFAAGSVEKTRGNMYLDFEGDMAVPSMVREESAGAPAPMGQKALPLTGGGMDDSYSKTNVQVEGVDEGDIVKTDGTNVYVLTTNVYNTDDGVTGPRIRIVRVQPASGMKVENVIDLTTANMTPTDLYVENGTLVVIGQSYANENRPVPMMKMSEESARMAYPYYGGTSQTAVRIYDVKNAAAPKLTRTLSFDGSQISSRRIGDKLYLVLQQGFNYWGGPMPLDTIRGAAPADVGVPQFTDSKTDKMAPVAPCNRIAILPRVPSPQYMTIAVVPTNDLSKDVNTSVILGDAQNVYSSLNNLYVATTRWNYNWDSARSTSQETTHVYRFGITDKGVELKAEGDVPGHILNQFSMDENGATFRIATTGNSWTEGEGRSTNNVYVLNMNMEQTGAVTDLAPGETIYSVRFVGDRAYVVTFKTVDPFFVIDLADPRNPKVLGQLKIPGFSNYLHPYDATHVIGFGKDVDESIDADKVHSGDAVYYTAIQGFKMALFDVKDVSNPKQIAVEVIGDRGTDSPILTNHKALLLEQDRDLLAFPILVTKRPAGSEKSADGNPVFQGTYVYDISVKDGFQRRGTITHYDNSDDFLKAGSYWYGGPKDISRVLRVGSQLITVSDSEIRSSSENTTLKTGSVLFQ